MTGMHDGHRIRRRAIAATAAGALAVAIAVGALSVGRLADDRDQPVARIRQWVAVLSVGADARSLYASATEVAKVAGVYVFVDRWSCYEGFPAGSPPSGDDWFLGVAATDRSIVDGIVAQLGRAPIVEAEVEQGCASPVDTTPVAPQS
jgi:hypothetical protein